MEFLAGVSKVKRVVKREWKGVHVCAQSTQYSILLNFGSVNISGFESLVYVAVFKRNIVCILGPVSPPIHVWSYARAGGCGSEWLWCVTYVRISCCFNNEAICDCFVGCAWAHHTSTNIPFHLHDYDSSRYNCTYSCTKRSVLHMYTVCETSCIVHIHTSYMTRFSPRDLGSIWTSILDAMIHL